MIKGLGVDSVELRRIDRVFREYDERFLKRIFTPEERAYALRFEDPVPRLAGRFAAKEACMKALGTGWAGGVRWCDIVVDNRRSGKPEMKLLGRARDVANSLGVTQVHVTITHNRDYATALVIFE
jgi:holo-[acyl-carrier protein] synthase